MTPPRNRFAERQKPNFRTAHRCVLFALTILLFVQTSARAHLGLNIKSLNTLVAEADLVIVGKVINPDRIYRRADLAFQQTYIEVKVLETIKGEAPHAYVDFFGHGHGIARYAKGHEAIFFLKEMIKNPVWRKSPLIDRFTYYSDQEVSQQFLLNELNRSAWTDAAKRYLAAHQLAPGPARADALRDITVDLLGNTEQKLSMLAAYDLMRAGNVYKTFSPKQIGKLKELAGRKGAHIRLRLLILQMLAADPKFPRYDRIVALYSESTESLDKISVLRALARCNEKRILTFAEPLLRTENRGVRRAAIDALGQPGLEPAVEILRKLLDEPGTTYYAPITYALGRIATKKATAVLRQAAENHPSKTVRRYAAAELRRKKNSSRPAPSTRPATTRPMPSTRPAPLTQPATISSPAVRQ